MVDRENKPARTVTSLKWVSGPNAIRLPPSMPQRAVVVHYGGTYYLEAPEVRRIPVEGLAGGRIETGQPPCESTSSPAQNSEKNNALWLTRSFRLNIFRCSILVLFGFMFYLPHNNAHRAKPGSCLCRGYPDNRKKATIIFHKKRQVANEKEVPFGLIVALPT